MKLHQTVQVHIVDTFDRWFDLRGPGTIGAFAKCPICAYTLDIEFTRSGHCATDCLCCDQKFTATDGGGGKCILTEIGGRNNEWREVPEERRVIWAYLRLKSRLGDQEKTSAGG